MHRPLLASIRSPTPVMDPLFSLCIRVSIWLCPTLSIRQHVHYIIVAGGEEPAILMLMWSHCCVTARRLWALRCGAVLKPLKAQWANRESSGARHLVSEPSRAWNRLHHWRELARGALELVRRGAYIRWALCQHCPHAGRWSVHITVMLRQLHSAPIFRHKIRRVRPIASIALSKASLALYVKSDQRYWAND